VPLYRRHNSPFWWVKLGRKTRKSTRTTDRAQAEEFERVLIKRLWRINELGDRGALSWKEAAERWLGSSSRQRRRDRKLLEWLEPKIGHEAVSDVDPDALEILRKLGIADGWSHSTVDRMMGTVSAVLHACVKWRVLDSAPSIPMYRPAREEARALTPEEFERLCNHLPMHLILSARLAVNTLLRMRAMLKLEWSRVDLEKRRAWIPGAHQKAARTFGFALSHESVRILRALRWLSPPDSPYVFVWNGQRIDDCNTAAFQKAVKKAGLYPLRWHDLRHTGASWAVQNGVSLQELMVLGDWRDYRSVLRYAHLAPSQAASAAEKVAQWGHTGKAAIERQNARKRA
jgi:integrase